CRLVSRGCRVRPLPRRGVNTHSSRPFLARERRMKVAPRASGLVLPRAGFSVCRKRRSRRAPALAQSATCGEQMEDDMERVRTTEAASHSGRQVRLQGWLHQFRELGKINFLIVRDGWGTFQAIVEEPAALEALRAVQVESVIEVRGVVAAEAQA